MPYRTYIGKAKSVLKHKLETDLLFFTRFFFKEEKSLNFIRNWHHEEIASKIYDVFSYNLTFLNINMPPRHTKTELAAVNAIPWGLAKNPIANFMYITASDSLRAETSSAIKRIINNEIYQDLWRLEFRADQNNKNIWRLKQGGGLMTATILGQITGFGAGVMRTEQDRKDNFDGAIILDDINKIKDATNLTKTNEQVNEVLANTVLSRKNTKDTPIINIQQRAGINDATAKFQNLYPENKKHYYMILPVRNEKNEPLWPFMLDTPEIDALENNPDTAYIFDTQYMQMPVTKEGLLFPESKLQRFELKDIDKIKDEITERFTFVDTADKGEDFFSAPFGYWHENKLYITDVIYNQHLLMSNMELLVDKTHQHNIGLGHGVIETNKEGTFFVGKVNEEIGSETYLGKVSKGNKEAMIESYADYILKYCVFRSDYKVNSDYYFFIKHLTRYLRGKTGQQDGAPDSLARLMRFLRYLTIIQ